ncbi:hypothetical protein A2572_04025 [Candidatus Collierbacteria bacterium RIFOXYD1_FULL_40_9]|uniref:Uncharacterized protein n=1 Tax=Candidatus Collierbacteria bacterium RIFOXYD1_FULL_40_9 TaxID=1817731 RepID=A0A1F5FWS0_9BACT|nr:MAG: hypothetical protein A2572_04025 [Candidatus Collierbacteria bacterium RIFOXYD1_FULL_40_9]
MKISQLLEELSALKIPKDQVAITSSGPIGIRDLRDIGDLDIIVTPKIWHKLSKKYKTTKEDNFESIFIGNIQVLGSGSWFTDPKYGTIEDDIKYADIIDGNRYVKLEKILMIKKMKDRQKDIDDVKLIENYLDKP